LSKLLNDYNGVLIDFFRGNWWSHCKIHLTLLTEHLSKFEKKNIKILSIASDSVRLLRKFKEENNFTIDIVSDRGAKIAKEYDVYWFAPGAGKKINIKQAVPSKYLINKKGIIVWKYIGKNKTDRPSIEMMMSIIDKYIINPKKEWFERKNFRRSRTTTQWLWDLHPYFLNY
jgi:peroxiredoxin